ncbi:MAG TPA: XdhC/CoxI family protein [Candidatus Omnitrophota bacterium]|nr:XdhC/CoxI family protein [Candidatus Omnitrophota bacterium]HPD85210.1 XdhC/CoxI family protein [Candidatus Omnitrophota bacterium]HRZ04289.1 XdhC/CoxI family protein [Candidatus Omnitrophota bacterium]
MNEELLQKALEAFKKEQSFAFATIVNSTLKGTPRKTGSKMIVLENGSILGSIGGGPVEKAAQIACRKAIKTRKTALITYRLLGVKNQPICGGQIDVFIEPFAGKKHLVICGAGHIALPLSMMAKILNFKVTVMDNRKEFASKRRFPHADNVILCNPAQALKRLIINQDTYIMIITHGHKYDFQCLQAALRTEAAYIGVISSRSKRIKFFSRLQKMGFSKNHLGRVSMPAGIDIGAQTPEEIAVCMMAEIIAKYQAPHIGTAKFKEK